MKEILKEAVNHIDDSFIDEVLEYEHMPKRNKKWGLTIAIAACFIMAVGLIIGINAGSKKVVARQITLEQDEYYIVYELYRNFGEEQGDTIESQYQFVVFNGKTVLESGISLKKPIIKKISERIVKVEYEYGETKKYIYCDLRTKRSAIEINADSLLLEWNERIAYYDKEEQAVIIKSMTGEKFDDIYEWIEVSKEAKNIKVNVDKDNKQAIVQFKTKKGKLRERKIKLCDVKNPGGNILKNTSKVECSWENKLIEKTEDYYIYDVTLNINRKVYESKTVQYQYFVKSKGKIIGEGCAPSSHRPVFEKIDENILRLCSYTVKYFDLQEGKISPEYKDAIYDWPKGVAHFGDWPSNYLIVSDIFSGKEITRSYSLIDVKLSSDKTKMEIVYQDNNTTKETAVNIIGNSKSICEYTNKYCDGYGNDKEITVIENDVVKMFDVGRKDIVANYMFHYFIYNKQKDKIIEVGEQYFREPQIEKINDDIVRIYQGYGTGAWSCQYVNVNTEQVSEFIDGAITELDNKVVTCKYIDNDTYINIYDMFGNEDEGDLYLLEKDSFCASYNVKIKQRKDNTLRVEYYSGRHEEYKKKTIEYR